jgi:hypothetical protein
MLARIHDRRARQFWDGGLLLSKEIVRATLADPARRERAPDVNEDTIVWDQVGLYGPSARWDGAIPEPEFTGGPVVSVADELRGRLAAAR